ncbi:hypothetical protein CHLRE_10g437250v5 [Chlamydomonas reinhardtii]|uniref:Flagellar associated protein n=1 Tax=Chlamydomonas reinhardtii TaxID=3055 RepID=A8IGA4_CHLRE|nr:uncharacterized protein CHLRE_10g437250v5 [Chlamydomonas reinhardtii]PNW77453.1 hypothetical protein CHLRE_10g437250v5 [Chlamydomonas reinhardtii]|eukprot:XP_001690393.1 predicted protein [Chlamydomonas reinhardtii]
MDWWSSLGDQPLPSWSGPTGAKQDGGGSTRGCGLVGSMRLHRAVNLRDSGLVERLVVGEGLDVNEVEAAGNTPLHNAAWSGWEEGVQQLLRLGAKVNASNNAGDRPWHWARNMGHTGVMAILEQHGAVKERGKVLVQEHVPKVKDFYSKSCWSHHPLPYADFVAAKRAEVKAQEAASKSALRSSAP